MQFYGSVYIFCDGQHNVGAEDEKDVVEEKQGKQERARLEVAQKDKLERMHTKNDCQDVVVNPAFAPHVKGN